MKEYMICTGLAPELTASYTSALRLLDPEGDIRIIQGGCSSLILSSLTKEEWDVIVREYPELLRITDDRGNVVFSVTFENESPGHVLEDQVAFGNTVTADGYATATILLDPDQDVDTAQMLKEALGKGLNRLAETEQMALAVLYRNETNRHRVRHRIVLL